jgi:hypothetical protein
MLKRILRGVIFTAAICAITSLAAHQAYAHGHGGVAIGIGVGGPGCWGPGCGYGPYYPPPYYAYPAPYYAYPAPYYAAPAYYPAATYYPAPGGVIVGP